MNTKKIYSLFFMLALGVAITWGVLEFIFYKTSSGAKNFACEMDLGSTYELADRLLLDKKSENLWLYNPQQEKIEQRHIGWKGRAPASELLREVPLRCETPGYHCFISPKTGGFNRLRPFWFYERTGLISAELKDRKVVVPFRVDSGGLLTLTTPLKICGDGLELDPRNYHFLNDRLYYFDSAKSLLAFWDLQRFEGLVTQAAAREPDGLLGINEKEGLILASCADLPQKRVPAQVVVAQERLFLLHDQKTHTKLRSYLVGPRGLEPDPRWKFAGTSTQKIWSGETRGLLHRSDDGTISRIWYSPSEGKFTEFRYPERVKDSLTQFAVADGGEIFMSTANYLLSSQKVIRLRDKAQESFKNFDFHFYRNKENRFFVYQNIVDSRGILIYPSTEDTRFIPFVCK